MINWLKTLRKKKIEAGKTEEQAGSARGNEEQQQPNWRYKLYVRFDEINGNLVEGLTPINWAEFLNRPIDDGSQEVDLVRLLTPGNLYMVGERLVRYQYEISETKIVVCDLARLSPKPEDNYQQWKNRHKPLYSVELDADDYKQEQEKKDADKGPEKHEIKEITSNLYI